jgi:nicotinamidase-related amidase
MTMHVPTALVAVDVQGTFADDFPGAGLPVPGSGATAIDAVRAGYESFVVPALSSVLEPDRIRETLAALRGAGVELVGVREVEHLLGVRGVEAPR